MPPPLEQRCEVTMPKAALDDVLFYVVTGLIRVGSTYVAVVIPSHIHRVDT